MAPARVTFSYARRFDTPIQSLSMDFDGDGTADLTSTDPDVPLDYTYTAAGLYTARLATTDTQGSVRHGDTVVLIEHPIDRDVLHRSIWDGMNSALASGNLTEALTFLDLAARAKYGPIWQLQFEASLLAAQFSRTVAPQTPSASQTPPIAYDPSITSSIRSTAGGG